ncbi:MAG: cupin domain-containing protein [Anaerolineae bacterium]|nr:cupin domain-containing protein [Anaerolineae bacterium]
MSKAGDVFENPVTGERAIVRVGSEESTDGWLVNDLYVRPGGAVSGEHVHPTIIERFTVQRGQVGFRIDGRETLAELGQPVTVPAGVTHDWWNAGSEEAHVLIEIYDPANRFGEMIIDLFGLAQDGKTNAKGMPNLFQTALFSLEYEDVLYFTNPPRWVQKILFSLIAPIARLLGYRGTYPEYRRRARANVEMVASTAS